MLTNQPYRQVKRGGHKTTEHRFKVEQSLGRPLTTEEHVHHKNSDKLDNRLTNLEVLDPTTHGRLHHLVHATEKVCVVCTAVFTPHKTKRKRQQTCGEATCIGTLIRWNRWGQN